MCSGRHHLSITQRWRRAGRGKCGCGTSPLRTIPFVGWGAEQQLLPFVVTDWPLHPTQTPHTISWELQQIPTRDGGTGQGCVYPLVCNPWEFHRSRRTQTIHQKLFEDIYNIALANANPNGKFCIGLMSLILGVDIHYMTLYHEKVILSVYIFLYCTF